MGIVNGLGIRSFSSVKVKVLLRELHRDHHPRFSLRAQGGKYCNLYKANMPGLKYGLCRFWQRTDPQPCSSMHGLKSGSCRFWQRTDSPPGSNILRRAAQTCSACKLAGVQIIPLPRRRIKFSLERFQIRRASACVPSRWKVLSGEFRRRPTALVNKFS
jgi:hypothetical protein